MVSERGGDKVSVRRVGGGQNPTPQEDLHEAIQRFLRRVNQPKGLADDAYRAVMKALRMPEELPK
jgi:hypothetical protein